MIHFGTTAVVEVVDTESVLHTLFAPLGGVLRFLETTTVASTLSVMQGNAVVIFAWNKPRQYGHANVGVPFGGGLRLMCRDRTCNGPAQ